MSGVRGEQTAAEDGFALGRGASVEALRRCLLTAPPDVLAGALDNPALGVDELLLILRNRLASSSLLMRIGGESRWTRRGAVRRLLVQHPQAPLALARRLLGHLFWNELADVALAPRAHPIVRRDAERLLRVRIEELSLGERIALARKVPRGVLTALLDSEEPALLRNALWNARMIEADAVAIARSTRAAPETLRDVAGHPKWGRRREVRLALLRNPRTPVPVALRILGRLETRDLRVLSRAEQVPNIVRIGARRRLAAPIGGRRGTT